jgi:hypothetical protein
MNLYRLLILNFFLLASCELMSQRKPLDPEPSKNIIMTYFISNQYPTSDENISAQLSEFFGAGISADPISSFANWVNPRMTCDYGGTFGIGVVPKRPLYLGNLVISHGENSASIEPSTTDYSWSFTGSLPASDYQLHPVGVNETASFTQTFKILEPSASVLTYIGNLQAPAFQVPSPTIPTAGNNNFDLHISRGQPFIVKVNAAPDTSYLRVRIRDGSNRATGDVLCYAKVGDNISIPPTLMSTFRTGTDGIIEIDQIHISQLKNAARVAESIVVSTTRQIHGTIEFLNNNNELERLEIGKLHIDP